MCTLCLYTLWSKNAGSPANDDEDKGLLFDTDASTKITINYKETVFLRSERSTYYKNLLK